jgi:AICAR transformylase/IMP cyclohydrolase PurH
MAVLDELRVYNGALTLATRERLAAAAFCRTAAYDRAISAYFASRSGAELLPAALDLHFERRQPLRYGENPHQAAAFYVEPTTPPGCVASAEVLHGKELSYNNLLDLECIIAPDFDEAAFQVLTTRPSWKKSVRLLRTGPLEARASRPPGFDLRRVDVGLLVQSRDMGGDDFALARVVTKRAPTEEEMADLRFAWAVCKHVKSNAIVLAQGGMLVGVGAGQMSRVDSVHIAVHKAGDRSRGSVLASDAFFPFRDNVDEAARAGVRAIVQPGGSMRDADSILACDEHGIAMVFTGVRHFRH